MSASICWAELNSVLKVFAEKSWWALLSVLFTWMHFSLLAIRLPTFLLFWSYCTPCTACRRITVPGLRNDCIFLHCRPSPKHCNPSGMRVCLWGEISTGSGGNWPGGQLGTMQMNTGFLPMSVFTVPGAHLSIATLSDFVILNNNLDTCVRAMSVCSDNLSH